MMAEINARALMFSLAPEDASDSTTAAKVARYAERKHLAYNLTEEGALSLDGAGRKIRVCVCVCACVSDQPTTTTIDDHRRRTPTTRALSRNERH